MATYLYRLGGWAFRRRRTVLLAWITVLGLVVASAAAFSGQTNSKFSVPGTESQQAQDLLEQKFPGAGGASARMVFAAPEGEKLTDLANKDAVEASLARAKQADGVTQVVDPYEAHTISKDGRIAYADVIYPVPADQIDDPARDELAASAEPARDAGLQVEFGGGIVTDESKSNSESMGMMIAFVVLVITFGSLLAAGLPLLTALIGVGIGVTGLTALTGVIDVSETAPILATMIGLAVGIDYALFILSRHRQKLGDGLEPDEAAARATGTAGSAVVFAGLTVVIALVGLSVVDIPFLTVMGLAAAGTVAVAVLVALTLLPALLGFAGAPCRPAQPQRSAAGPRRRRTPRRAMRHPLGALRDRAPACRRCSSASPSSAPSRCPRCSMQLGLPDGGSEPTVATERRAYDLLTEGFGPGFNGPLAVVVDAPRPSAHEQKDLGQQARRRPRGRPRRRRRHARRSRTRPAT